MACHIYTFPHFQNLPSFFLSFKITSITGSMPFCETVLCSKAKMGKMKTKFATYSNEGKKVVMQNL